MKRAIAKLQKNIGRELNVTNLSLKEFEAKKKDKDAFIKGIFKTKTIKLV
ncbi:MAG: hypothetical protein NTW13_03215 [Candidatus Omnitrophica bacterium]|nr:hypothetical protein [Candidatus Omnitrophota bacterium]